MAKGVPAVLTPSQYTMLDLDPHGFAVIDTDLVETVNNLKVRWKLDTRTRWRPRAHAYVKLRQTKKYQDLRLEKLALGAKSWQFVRFLNRNTLDCRRDNLQKVPFCRDVIHPDQEQYFRWKLEFAYGREGPQQRREEAWRMWTEELKPDEIAKRLWTTKDVVIADIKAMAADPAAAVGL